MSRYGRLIFSLAAVVVLCGVSTNVQADTITISGVNSGQAATATVVCEFNSQTNTLTFTITNTSAITQPGSTSTITGIGYDLPPLGNASTSGLNGFTGTQAPSLSSTFNFSDADLGNVPAGFNNVVLDFGFTTGPSGNFNGGSVNDGLLPGESASFTVTGAAFTDSLKRRSAMRSSCGSRMFLHHSAATSVRPAYPSRHRFCFSAARWSDSVATRDVD